MKWDDENEMSQLLEVFSDYDCRIMVNSENIIQVIEEIAHKELLQKPTVYCRLLEGYSFHTPS